MLCFAAVGAVFDGSNIDRSLRAQDRSLRQRVCAVLVPRLTKNRTAEGNQPCWVWLRLCSAGSFSNVWCFSGVRLGMQAQITLNGRNIVLRPSAHSKDTDARMALKLTSVPLRLKEPST